MSTNVYPGRENNPRGFDMLSPMEDLNFYRFVEAWHVNLRGPKTVGEMVDYAEMFGVRLEGETERGKATALGRLINAHAGQVIEFNGRRMIIERGKLSHGKVRYQVHPAAVMSTGGNGSGHL